MCNTFFLYKKNIEIFAEIVVPLILLSSMFEIIITMTLETKKS